MTRAEKSEVIEKYCKGMRCNNCVIHHAANHKQGICWGERCSDEEIDRNYNLIVSQSTEQLDTPQAILECCEPDVTITVSSKKQLESITIYFKEG